MSETSVSDHTPKSKILDESIKKNECRECGGSNVKYLKEKDEILCNDWWSNLLSINTKGRKKI